MNRVTDDRNELEIRLEVEHATGHFWIMHVIRSLFENKQLWIAVRHLVEISFVALKHK